MLSAPVPPGTHVFVPFVRSPLLPFRCQAPHGGSQGVGCLSQERRAAGRYGEVKRACTLAPSGSVRAGPLQSRGIHRVDRVGHIGSA